MIRLNRRTWSQFVSLAKPYWVSEQKWIPWTLSALLIGLLLAYTKFTVIFNRLLGDFASALADSDVDRFWSGMRLFLVLLVIAVPINAFYYFVRDKLAIYWRQWLTAQFLGDYFRNRAYYSLATHPDIDNPDQRIAEDINTFTQETLQFLLIVVNGLMQLVAFCAVLWAFSKLLVGFLVVYAVMGTVFTIAVFGKGLTVLNYLQLQREANFRFSLVRVRENAESIAFYQGEDKEFSQVAHRFGQAVVNSSKLIWWQLFLSKFQYANSYACYLLPYAILAPAILRGDLEVGAVVEAGGAFSACLVALNLVINNFNGLSKFAAGIDRLDTFKRAMTSELVTSPGEDRIQHRVGADLRMEGVTLNVPQQERVLVKNLSLSVAPGTHLVITGPSGCGKTSLLRAIIGLWHQGRGSIVRPKLDDILFLPQRPYMVAGTLRQQLLYPRLDRKVSDAELLAMLRRVQLGHLADCDAPLDVESDWSKLLSIGEQQRLSFARVLLIRPRYAFLDEATSALDPDTEELLYRQLAKSGATMVSVSHHAALHKHHSLELELLGDGEWRLRPIRGQRAVKSIVPWTRMALVPRPNVEVHGS